MANMTKTTNLSNTSCSGKQSFLPPKSPIPSISPGFADYNSSACIVSKAVPKTKEGYRHHQRTSSESFLLEEQPSWLDDLLKEPETPVKRGAHRRSSSDSFAYLDASNISSIDCNIKLVQEEYRCVASVPSRRSQDVQYASYHAEASHFVGPLNRGWESAPNTASYTGSLPLAVDKYVRQNPGSTGALREPDSMTSTVTEKHDQEESASQGLKVSSEFKEGSHAKYSQPEVDPKRVKQQFAQRSRVRKLQYIAELERNVQALQAEGSEVSAELEFLDQQNLILSLENKALKQRLDSVAQEQLLKRLQQEVLEKEIARLQVLYQQQQQPQPTTKHGRSRSRDLDNQFANLSLRHKEANSALDPITGPLHI